MSKSIDTSTIRRYNIIAGVFHLLQMIAVLALANDFTLPIVARYMSGPPGTTFAEPITVLDTPVGLTVAIFLGLSAFFHFLVASPQFFARYSAGLTQNRNYFRWVEYSISSSVMIVLIAQIVGVTDIAAIIAIFGVNASMILFGWLQETGMLVTQINAKNLAKFMQMLPIKFSLCPFMNSSKKNVVY